MKIAICTPVHTDTKSVYSQCLARMIVHSMKQRPDLDLDVLIRAGSILLVNRNQLVKDAAQFGADAILWLDADHYFPPDTLLQLLAHDKDIIGCNYAKRSSPTTPTATGPGDVPIWTTPEKTEAGEVEEVWLLGLGVMFVKASVFETIEWPFFNSGYTTENVLLGEDTHFCNRAREAGFRIWCDHKLSWQIGHIYDQALWNMDAIRDRQ
jgi:hypothetical protein